MVVVVVNNFSAIFCYIFQKQEAKLILVSEPEWQKRACASQNNAQPSNQTQDQTTSHTTNQTHDVIANQPHNEATDQTTNQPNQQMHAQTTQQTINQAQSQTTQQAHAQTSNNSHAQTTQQTINQAQSQTTQQAHAQTSNNSHAQTTQQPSKQTQDQTTSHTTNQTNDVTTRNQPHTQTTEQTTNQQTHAQTAQQTHAQTTNQAHVQTSSQTNAPTNHSQRPLKNLQINTQPFSGPGLNFNPSIDEGAAAVTPTVATEFEAFPFDNMSTPSIIRQAITLMDNAETPTQLNPTANGNVTRQLFEGDAPFQDLFPSPGASDRRITQVWDRKMDALNKKMAVVSTQLADLTRMMTFVMQRLNGDYVRNNDYARNNVNIQPYPTYAQEDVLPEPNQQHQQQEVPAFDIVPATSADETFHDIPAHCRISSEKLLQMKTSANSIGNFATFLCARLYPELFTADNLRLKYNYYGQRAQKEPLEQQRRTILERYLLYFYPQLNDPRVFHLNVVNPINEFLRRKVVNLKNALIFG